MVSKQAKIGLGVVGVLGALVLFSPKSEESPILGGGGGFGGFFGNGLRASAGGIQEPASTFIFTDVFGDEPAQQSFQETLQPVDIPTTTGKRLSFVSGFSPTQIENIGGEFTQDLGQAKKEGGGFAGGRAVHEKGTSLRTPTVSLPKGIIKLPTGRIGFGGLF